ncbi:MAG: hypothetical protein BWY57_00131 [Betaproteobacteria bacterium ADurb.Bin341]|nr:MAG: hypothetical protein BWY57_00131 [Betaproteobacteria bacterium ADurb.Bin341]
MKRSISFIALLAALFALAACGKVAEKATEKLAEKALESQSKDGAQASVNLSEGTAKVTVTDASGKASTVELGSAQVSEADLGVPFYPGTKPPEGGVSKVTTPQGTAMTVSLHSSDTADKVTAFYREKLKSQSQDKQFMDMNMGSGQTTLMLADDKTNDSIQVHVKASGSGSDINIVATRGTK